MLPFLALVKRGMLWTVSKVEAARPCLTLVCIALWPVTQRHWRGCQGIRASCILKTKKDIRCRKLPARYAAAYRARFPKVGWPRARGRDPVCSTSNSGWSREVHRGRCQQLSCYSPPLCRPRGSIVARGGTSDCPPMPKNCRPSFCPDSDHTCRPRKPPHVSCRVKGLCGGGSKPAVPDKKKRCEIP